MERNFIILFFGLALLGSSISQYESSGDEQYGDEFPEESGDLQHQLSDCQLKRIAYKENKLYYDPHCLTDGQFAPQQCSHDVCWCVDRHGNEIVDTRGSRDCDAYADGGEFIFVDPREVKPVENDDFIFHHPGMLAGVIGGIVVCLLGAVLVVMFIVYRMKKKDEGSYILGRAERKNSRSVIYTKAVPRDQEFYA